MAIHHGSRFPLGVICVIASFAFVSVAVADQSALPNTPTPANTAKAVHTAQQVAKPRWTELSPAQQHALAPLASEWDKLDSFRKGKWLAIANKFPSMKPDEQQRMQERMHDWVSLTPEQRRVARESFARAKKLNPDQKSAQWERYQQLPDEQKKKLAAGATSKKPVATLPPAAAQGKQQIPPIKSAPKPVLEQSVTPQAASQSALQPAPQPNK